MHEAAERQKRGEAVAELNDTECCNDADKSEEIWNAGSDNESYTPVNWYNDGPKNFTRFRVERRSSEKIHQDVVVEDFDADVAVQACSDNAGGDHREDITGSLPAVGRNALVRKLVRVPV